jgi:hypothetical protein
MTENSLSFVFCRLFSVLCPLYLPDTFIYEKED